MTGFPVLGRSDDRGRGDSDLGRDLAASAIVGSGLAGFESGDVPEVRAGVGVVGIDGGVLGGNDQQIVGNAGDGHGGQVEGLRVNQAVGGNGEELAESCGVHVG